MTRTLTLLVSTFALPGLLSAQSGEVGPSPVGVRPTLPAAHEIALARSAAPEAVSAEATVLVWDGSEYSTAVDGSNGATCYVGRSWPASLEPHCFDEEGSRTILPIHLYETRRRHEGAEAETIEAEIGRRLADGTFRLPSRPVMSYMMSAAQELISDQGDPAGAWLPHLMIYYPYLTPEGAGLGPVPSMEAAVITDPGTPMSSIMIVVRNAVEPDDPGREPRTP
jgi:hypothetical protein